MAKNFGKSPAAKRFDEVAKTTMVNTNAVAIVLLENSKLFDCPDNGEDITYTADIENSIAELGFTDPLEVTDYEMPDGQYMIVSGHRRRAAGVKRGMDLFPCIIKSFDNKSDMQNYVLLSNSQRDSIKDPLLYCRRYRLHEEHLKSINFKGSIREEIAKRLGVSVQQADRYNQMNKIISPVWDLVRKDIVGMSSVLPMAALTHEEQHEILTILKKAVDDRIELTREKVKQIIEDYKKNYKIPHREDNQKSLKKLVTLVKNMNGNLQKISDLKDFEDTGEAQNLLSEMEKMLDTVKNIIENLRERK